MDGVRHFLMFFTIPFQGPAARPTAKAAPVERGVKIEQVYARYTSRRITTHLSPALDPPTLEPPSGIRVWLFCITGGWDDAKDVFSFGVWARKKDYLIFRES